MAQLVVGAAGAVAGFFVGGPTGAYYGYAIASTLYAVTRPGPHSEGPRLQDLKVTGTEYGQTIPYVFGHPRVPVQIVWASEKRENANTTTQGKGGGPSYTEYSYEVDLLCILSDNQIAGGARVWDNGKLIYTRREDASADSLTASEDNDRWRRITFYDGAADQLPDPIYEAAVGVGSAPAYRGRGTVFIEALQLGTSGQLPNLTIEVTRTAQVGGQGVEVQGWALETNSIFGNNSLALTAFSRSPYLWHQVLWDANHSNNTVSVFQVSRGQEPILVGGYEVTFNQDHQARGRSDVSGLMTRDIFSPLVARFYTGEVELGAFMPRTITFALADAETPVVCVKAGVMYMAHSAGAIRRYDAALGGAFLAANTTTVPADIISMACDGSVLYALSGTLISRFDAVTLEFIDSFAAPSSPPDGLNKPEVYFDDGKLYVFDANPPQIFVRDEGVWRSHVQWTKIDGSDEGMQQQQGDMIDGIWYRIVGRMVTSTVFRTAAYQVGGDTISPQDETLQAVVSALMLRAGYDASEFDVSELASITKPVRALAISQVGATRATLDLLMSSYFFECVLSDKLYFRPRSTDPVKTIIFDDLGASNSPEGDPEPFALKLRNELEVPAQIAVTYANVIDDYQNGTEYSDRALSSQDSTTAVQIAVGMLPAEAKGVADAIAMDNVASLAGTTLKVPFCLHAELEASDVVNVVTPDASYRMRLATRKDAGGILEFEAVVDDADALESAQITDEDYIPQTEVQTIATTVWEAMDIPPLRDADADAGWYGAVKPGDGDIWPGAAMLRSWDDVTFAQVATYTDQAVFGTCNSILPGFLGGNVFDEASTLTVDVGDGELSSSTRDAMLTDLMINVLLVGSEIIRFRIATLLSPGVYALSGFIRGFRGTDWAKALHVADERCVLLRTTGIRRIATENSQLNVPSYIKAVTFNRPLSTAVSEEFTDTGVSLKPFRPTDLRGARDASSNLTLTWKRQTRLSFRFLAEGVDPPLGEAIELYDVEIWDSTFTTLKRSILSLTAPALVYSAAEQTTDFGSAQAVVYARVYQRSAVVGRGYPLQGAA